MSFGKRQILPSPATLSPSATPAARERGGSRRVGYLWAFLAIAVSSFVSPAIMATLPALNRSGQTQARIAQATVENVMPSLLVVCAITLPLIDLALKTVNRRQAWLYAVINAVAVVLFYNCAMGIMGAMSPLWTLGLALLPATLGGYVLGVFRSR